jgi:hypothetical protein
MVPCDHFQTLLWEDQFGLLEAPEREGLRQHLATCTACQAERVNAEAGYRRLVRATRLDVVVPLFKISDAVSVPVVSLSREPLRVPVARRWRWRPWMAAAAAVLLAVGVLYGLYYQGLTSREAAFQKAEAAVKDVIAQRADARQQVERDARALLAQHQAANLRLQVLGPAGYERDGRNEYRVLATDLAGAPAEVTLAARLVDATGRGLGEVRKASGSGDLLLAFDRPAVDPSLKAARLEIEAHGLGKDVKLQAQIPVLGPAYVTHLALDKHLYRLGERIFFRSVTLKRSDLKPPDQSLSVTYTLKGPDGKLRESKTRLTRPGDGIGTWVFALPADCPEGEYALDVTETENRFSPAKRRLEVRGALPEDRAAKAPTSDQLCIDLFPEGGDLVRDMPCRVYFRAHDGHGQPVDLTGFLVDSQGHQVASLRTRGGQGQPALSHGLGVFTLPPRSRGPLKLGITSPRGIATPVDLLVRGGGRSEVRASHLTKTVQGNRPLEILVQELSFRSVGLAVPTAVTRADEPLRVKILSNASVQPWVVGVFCRGRLVAEKAVSSGWGQTEVRLTPPLDVHGILRVTLFQAERDHLNPVAERLVYRQPAKPLKLSLAAQEEKYSPGQRVRLLVRSSQEKETAEKSWLLVSVVNEAALGRAKLAAAALPSYFYLGTELEQAAEVDGGDLLLSENPRAAEALDLFLSTQGWRRFLEPAPGTALAKNQTSASPATASERAAGLLRLDNLEDVERTYHADVQKGMTGLQTALAARNAELTAEGKHWREEARQTAQALDIYRARTAEYMRLGIGSGALATFATGCIFLSLAGARLVRRRLAHRPYLAGAFVALLLCLIIYAGRPRAPDAENQVSELKKVEHLEVALRDAGPDQQLTVAELDTPRVRLAALAPAKVRVEEASPLVNRPGSEIAKRESGTLPGIDRGTSGDFKPLPSIAFAVPGPQRPGTAPLLVREYAYDLKKPMPQFHPAGPDTLLWKPVVITSAGSALVEFDLPKNPGTYRVRVEGHTSSGRLGSLQRTLEVHSTESGPTK